MSDREFEDYLNHCKRDVTKAFNIGKKFYLLKFNSGTNEEDKFKRLFDEKTKEYLDRKFFEIDQK